MDLETKINTLINCHLTTLLNKGVSVFTPRDKVTVILNPQQSRQLNDEIEQRAKLFPQIKERPLVKEGTIFEFAYATARIRIENTGGDLPILVFDWHLEEILLNNKEQLNKLIQKELNK